LSKGDIPAVADLWMKVFRKGGGISTSSLRAYFKDIFLEHPWTRAGISSLVYLNTDGDITGFLGVLPRPLTFKKQPVYAAVSSQFMIDSDRHHGNGAIQLMRRFVGGPQVLSLTDGATPGAARIWEALGGETSTLYSCVWTRVLRPGQHSLDLAKTRLPAGPIAAARIPVRLLDHALTRMPLTAFPIPTTRATGEKASSADLVRCIAELSPRWTLCSSYTVQELEWLLLKAREATTRGDLRKTIVRNEKGEILGWHIYYLKTDGVSKVLQIGGREQTFGDVINHMFHDAWRSGAAALSGRLEPRFARELSRRCCRFIFHDVAVLVHSRHNEILEAIHRGDAFLTRLDGEWWLRFHEEHWL
jgi:hypothetical protein